MNEVNPEPRPLTPAQRRTLLAIQEYIDKHGYAPSVREMAKATGLASAPTAHMHLKNLAESGYIVYEGVRRIRVLVRI